MASEPAKAEGNYTARGKIHAMVTHRPGEQRTDEVSIQAGYVYKEASPVEVDVGGLKVRLFTEGESAWTVDKDSDKKLVQAMIKGRSEEHTSELQSLMRISYAVFCLNKKKAKMNRSTAYNT